MRTWDAGLGTRDLETPGLRDSGRWDSGTRERVRPDMFACLFYRESPGRYKTVSTQEALKLVGSHGERSW